MNVFKDQAGDARQTNQAALPAEASLFRKRYRQLSADEVRLHDAIKDKADELAQLIASIRTAAPVQGASILENVATNPGANVTLALRHVEDAVYRAVKALTA